MPLLGLLMLPVTLLAGPAVSYNLLVVVLPGVACYALYRVARLWLPSGVGAVARGPCSACPPWWPSRTGFT